MAAIGLLEVEFILPTSQSLKDKRRVLRSIKDHLAGKFNVSVAEVGYQEKLGRCQLAVVSIAAERLVVEKRLREVEDRIESHTEISVIDRQVQWL
ncbi:MAG TPA: DUF503 domain-containing protein [Bacteroidetes bacterium]|nr:hypothetical protein BMS3Bbin04_00578 [bacterium BMS3Bbin04]HDO65292.1 DUF503 domain-containing protein [Bacteroidota bacterium]HEX04417.1 DUF503 domain-containing protein [Bacteroidota bacterium]